MGNIITIDNVLQYLLKKGFIDTKSTLGKDFDLIDASSKRNRVLKVIRKHGKSYIVKQPCTSDPYSKERIRTEAILYGLSKVNYDFAILRGIVPHILDFDVSNDIMILDLVSQGQPLSQFICYKHGRAFLKDIAHELGRLLASYHRAFEVTNNASQKILEFFPKKIPSTLGITDPESEISADISRANLQLLKFIQKCPELYQSLNELRSDWHFETLMHGDIRFDNVMISHANNKRDPPSMKIIDWELADIGDPAWDIGGALHDFISVWLSSLHERKNESSWRQVLGSTENLILNIQDSIRTFWDIYKKTSGIEGLEAIKLLRRSTKYCAIFFIQSAYESLTYSTELSGIAISMLQVSLKILRNLNHTITHLLGIPFRVNA
jgi:thiamine kinase-like enzyme